MDGGERAEFFPKNVGREQSCLERWSNLFSQAWELCADKVCEVSEEVFGHGTQRWLRYGASAYSGAGIGAMSFSNRGRSSHKSQSSRQSIEKSNVVQNESRTQIVRGATTATITEIEYVGKMWCVEVSTGAFVARRKGKIFITGNSGFPKSHNVSKGIDRAAGAKRKVIGKYAPPNGHEWKLKQADGKSKEHAPGTFMDTRTLDVTAPATDDAKQWEGWGSALKPAVEPVVLARKPLSEKTLAANVLKWGTGALNIDGCRVMGDAVAINKLENWSGFGQEKRPKYRQEINNGGRWPANLIHDGSDEVLGMFPDVGKGNGKGVYSYAGKEYHNRDTSMFNGDKPQAPSNFNDSGSAARFYYCAKANKRDRGDGNNHPTVKPVALMQYLCRLITPSGGLILDPFMGSGSTGKAAMFEGFRFIGIDLDKSYCRISKKRIEDAKNENIINKKSTE